MPVSELLSAAVALLPGLYLWWRGRRLVRRIDDPVFPDLYLRRWSHSGAALGVAWALILMVLETEHGGLWIFLSVAGLVASGYPLRKRVFGETWGLFRYLGFVVRFALVTAGSLLLLACLPALAGAAGADLAPAVAAATGFAVVLWSVFQARISVFLLAARPLVDEELKERFTPLTEKAGCVPPRVYRFGFRGGFLVNAFALPSRGWSTVVMSDDLLEVLEPREAAAIFAHELAHLEHYTPRRVLGGRFTVMVLTALIVGLVLGFGPGSDAGVLIGFLWPVVCLVAFLRAVMANREHEGPSDLRALELTGDAEALISALTKVHAAARLPQSWEPSIDEWMSHPSLAARLQAIRRKAGLEEEGAPAPADAPPSQLEGSLLGPVVVRLLALAGLLGAVLPPVSGAFGLAALALLIRPGVAALAAAGTTALAGLVLAVRRASDLGSDLPPLFPVFQAVLGVFFLLEAWLVRRRVGPEPMRGLPLVLAALGAAALGSTVFAAVTMRSAYPTTSLHLWARGGPALVAAAFGAAAALVAVRAGRRARLEAAAVALFGLLALVPGTTAFRDRFGGDPLRSTEPRLETVPGRLETIREHTFGSGADRVEISPTGRRLAVGETVEEPWGESLFSIEREGDGVLELRGVDLEFLGDDFALVLVRETETLKLRTIRVDSGETADELELPDMAEPRLSFADDGSWRVTGSLFVDGDDVAVRVTGGAAIRSEERFQKVGTERIFVREVLFNTTDSALGIGARYGEDVEDVSGPELLRLAPGGEPSRPFLRTSLPVRCFEPFANQSDYVCATENGERTQLWAVDPERGSWRPLGSVQGRFTEGWVAPGQFLLWRYGGSPILAEPRHGRAVDFAGALRSTGEDAGPSFFDRFLGLGDDVFYAIEAVAFRPPFLAVAVRGGEGSTVTLYRLADPLVPEAGRR